MVNRSNNNANPNGGVAYVNSNNEPSNANANIGSRLANRKNFKRSSQPQTTKNVPGNGYSLANAPQPVKPHYTILADGSEKTRDAWAQR